MTLGVALAFLCGALLAFAMPPPQGAFCSLALLFVAAVAAVAWGRGCRRTTAALVALLIGLAYTALHVCAAVAARWPIARDGERVLVEARILSIPVAGEFGTTFDAALAPDPRARFGGFKARVAWVHPRTAPRVGERWRLVVRLRAPRASANPVGPDMERIWFRDGIGALGTVLPWSRLNARIDAGAAPLDRLRARIARHIATGVADRDAAALLAALAVGVTGDLSREQWRVFNATGTTHLVAISGMHVTLFAVLAIAVARRLWRVAGPLRDRVPREPFAALLGIVAALGYALLAGLSVPTLRTLVMLAAWLLARAAARAQGPLQSFAIAIVVVLVLDPFAPLASGFWLSFVAVAAIVVAAGSRTGRAPWWREAARVQLAVTIALVPVTLAAFGGVSLASLVVNVVAIPFFTLLLVPLTLASTALLACTPALADIGFAAGAALHAVGWPWLEAAASWPYSVLALAPPPWAWLVAVPAVAMAILPWPLGLRMTSLAALAPLAAAAPLAPAAAQVAVTIFDVGRGQAAVIRTAHAVVVYGTGDSFGTNGRRMARVVVPWLRLQRIARVDRLVLPRLQADQASGAAELVAALDVGEILVPRAWPGGPARAVPCAALPAWQHAPAHFALTADCDMALRVGPHRLEFGRAAHFETTREGAISLTIDAATSAVARRASRDGYPWPWRAPV
ncbi:MAG: DNA internalization-related competence protein ComEC/Rec2 [Steroidobacteraceae bacterium]